MKNIVITGANGFIGRNLIRRFLNDDCKIYAVDLADSVWTDYYGNKVVKIECNLESIFELTEKISTKGADVFYHLAWDGSTGVLRSDYARQLKNAKYTCDAAAIAGKLNCKRFISTGTISERIVDDALSNGYRSQNLVYAIAKKTSRHLLDILCSQLGMSYTWVQLSNIFGGNNKNGNLLSYTINEINQKRIPEFGPCDQIYDFLYIDDAIEALYRIGMADHAKKFYFVGSGSPRYLQDYIVNVGKQMNAEVGIGVKPSDNVIYKKEWFNTDDLKNDFNFEVKYTFEQAIDKIINEMDDVQ